MARSESELDAMGTYSELESDSDSDSPDTDARIDAKAPTADRSIHTAKSGALIPADSSNGSSDPLRLFGSEAEAYGDNTDERLGLLPYLVGLLGDDLVFGTAVSIRFSHCVSVDPIGKHPRTGWN